MDNRKWEADAAAAPPGAPAAPSSGYPSNGNPLVAQNATEPGEWWFHAIGEELRAIIVDGGLTPDLNTLTQVRDAIRNMINGGDYKPSVRVASTVAINLAAPGDNIDGVAMVAGDRFLEKDHATPALRGIYIWNGAAVAATRAADADAGTEFNGGAIIPVEEGTVNADSNWQITNDGTVTIGTTALTFNSVSGATFASDAEAQAYALTNKAISPATLFAALQGSNQSLVASGYQKLPGGLIIQWGISSAAIGGSTITFPISFPNGCHAVLTSGANNNDVAVNGYSPTLSNFTANSISGSGGPYTFSYISIGS